MPHENHPIATGNPLSTQLAAPSELQKFREHYTLAKICVFTPKPHHSAPPCAVNREV